MYLDKIYELQTGVSLKISTSALEELISDAVNAQKNSELENILSISDLCRYLMVTVVDGAEGLIQRRESWVDQSTRTMLMEAKPVSFDSFCGLFWRTLDEVDHDGDEWHQLIASDQFYDYMTLLLNKVRAIVRDLQHQRESMLRLPLGSNLNFSGHNPA